MWLPCEKDACPIRLWYPSQHLLRQNPLPRSQFGSPRRFPSAAHLGRFLQRLQLASNSAFAALTVGAWPSVRAGRVGENAEQRPHPALVCTTSSFFVD